MWARSVERLTVADGNDFVKTDLLLVSLDTDEIPADLEQSGESRPRAQ